MLRRTMTGNGLSAMPSREHIFRRQEGQNNVLPGLYFLGITINCFLWGIQLAQSYYYYRTFRKTDSTWVKVAVGLLFLSEATQSGCASQAAWRFMVDGWIDQIETLHPGLGVQLIALADAFTASIVHCFYAQKIWTLVDRPYNVIWTIVVLTLSSLQFIAGTGCTTYMLANNIEFLELYHVKKWICVWLAGAAMTDVVITTILVRKLSKSRTGIQATDDIISKLIRLIVETGLTTAIGQLIYLIIWLRWPAKPNHVLFTFIIAKFYSNSMMALLNSRDPPRSARDQLKSCCHGPVETLEIFVAPTQSSSGIESTSPRSATTPVRRLGANVGS